MEYKKLQEYLFEKIDDMSTEEYNQYYLGDVKYDVYILFDINVNCDMDHGFTKIISKFDINEYLFIKFLASKLELKSGENYTCHNCNLKYNMSKIISESKVLYENKDNKIDYELYNKLLNDNNVSNQNKYMFDHLMQCSIVFEGHEDTRYDYIFDLSKIFKNKLKEKITLSTS